LIRGGEKVRVFHNLYTGNTHVFHKRAFREKNGPAAWAWFCVFVFVFCFPPPGKKLFAPGFAFLLFTAGFYSELFLRKVFMAGAFGAAGTRRLKSTL